MDKPNRANCKSEFSRKGKQCYLNIAKEKNVKLILSSLKLSGM